MRMERTKGVVLSVLLLMWVSSNAQNSKDRKYLMVGDTIPDHAFTELVNFPKKSVKISDFRGKWLVLDFWAFGCSKCIQSYPKMDSLSLKYRDKGVQILMVAALNTDINNLGRWSAATRTTYATVNRRYNLKGTTAFDDSLYFKYDIGSVPHIMVVDPNGILIAKTTDINVMQIDQLLSGKAPYFEPNYSKSEPREFTNYKPELPMLTQGLDANGGSDTSYIYRSLLTIASDKMPFNNGAKLQIPYVLKEEIKKGRLEIFRYSFLQLYRLAYFGRWDWSFNIDSAFYSQNVLYPIIEFQDNRKIDWSAVYSYSLTLPPDSKLGYIQKCLQQDLERSFGLNARLERRKVPVYYFRIQDRTKLQAILKDDGGERFNSVPENGIWRLKNYPLRRLLNAVVVNDKSHIPFIDMTGISSKVTVDFQSDLINGSDNFRALEQIGISVEKGEKEMNVVILR